MSCIHLRALFKFIDSLRRYVGVGVFVVVLSFCSICVDSPLCILYWERDKIDSECTQTENKRSNKHTFTSLLAILMLFYAILIACVRINTSCSKKLQRTNRIAGQIKGRESKCCRMAMKGVWNWKKTQKNKKKMFQISNKNNWFIIAYGNCSCCAFHLFCFLYVLPSHLVCAMSNLAYKAIYWEMNFSICITKKNFFFSLWKHTHTPHMLQFQFASL